MKQRLLTVLVLAAFGLGAHAKIPAPVLDDAAKAKAAEAAAKTAWQAKVDAWQLCKSQDKVAAKYKAGAGKNVPVKGAIPVAAKASAPVVVAAAASAPKAGASMPAAGASAPRAGASAPGTPVALQGPAPCLDPGVFAYNAPEQKPLETAGAHSPTGTAASPPSVKPDSATMAPAKPSTVQPGGAAAPKK